MKKKAGKEIIINHLCLSQFDDLNGMYLQHGRRIRWCKLPQEYDFGNPVFGANPTRFSKTWSKEVIDFTERFMNSPLTYWQTAPLPELPYHLKKSASELFMRLKRA